MTFRKNLLLIHRWAGLVLAAFLVLAGVTGSLLAFHHEIDAWLTPELHAVVPQPQRASLDGIAARIEAKYPGLVVGYFLFTPDPEMSIRALMNTQEAANDGRLDRDTPVPSEVFIDPYSGKLLGERKWGELGTTRAHWIPMVYRLHMSLFLDNVGQWITGIVAAIWIITLFIGMVLALPHLRHLRKAFKIKWRASRARVFFDLHRAVGLVSAVVLVVMAFTGLYMNLPQVVEPVVAAITPFSERPAALHPKGTPRPEVWRVGWDAAYATARGAHADGPVAGIGKIESRGYYQIRFLVPGDITDAGTIRTFVDGRNARLIGLFDHRDGTVGDKIKIWQFPLHSGQAFGLFGRILVCVTGMVPLLLSVTGVWLWWRRTRLRRRSEARTGLGLTPTPSPGLSD